MDNQNQSTQPETNSVAPEQPVSTETNKPFETIVVGEDKSRTKKWLPLAIAAGAVLLLGGGASAYYVGIYQNPDKVLTDAFHKLSTATHVQATGNLDIDMPAALGFKFKSIEYSTKAANNPSGDIDMKLNALVASEEVSLAAKGRMTENGDLYFQINNLRDTVEKIYGSFYGASGLESEAANAQLNQLYSKLEELQGKWVKITTEDLKKQDDGEKTAKQYQCVLDAYKQHKGSFGKVQKDAFKQHRFVERVGDAKKQDGKIGIELKLNADKAKEYAKATNESEAGKAISKCLDEEETKSTDKIADEAKNSDVKVVAWMDNWTHELKDLEYTVTNKSEGRETKLSGKTSLTYDKNVKVEAPADAMSFEEFQKKVNNLSGGVGNDDSGDFMTDDFENL